MSEQESKELGGLARTKRANINEVYNNTPQKLIYQKNLMLERWQRLAGLL